MFVKEFADRIAEYAVEIGCDGNGRIASHKIPSAVHVRCADSDEEYELVGIDIEQLMGCGCWAGIVLEIRKVSGE